MSLPAFEVVARRRPVDLVAPGATVADEVPAPGDIAAQTATPHPAPCAAVVVQLGDLPAEGDVTASLSTPEGTRLTARLDVGSGVVTLDTDVDGTARTHRSRRHGRVASTPTALGLVLTGSRLVALTEEDGTWTGRAWFGLRPADEPAHLDTHDPAWTAALRSGWAWSGEGPAPVVRWRAGGFGQLGLRDVRLVTDADGSPYRSPSDPSAVWLTATSAGPGFFDTAHTSVWRLDREGLDVEHRADLFFTRPDGPEQLEGVYGDHATHLLRDGDRWLVATSTWGDFDPARKGATVEVTLAETDADLLTGRHVLATRALDLPVDGLRSVGVWDPHLVRGEVDGATEWRVAFVSARKFFVFHPVLAAGPDLDTLAFVGAADDRTATEGSTLLPPGLVGDDWVLAASDGPDSRRALRRRYPVLAVSPDEQGRLPEVGVVEAPYPTNLPWPTVVPPPTVGAPASDWLLVTFDGTPTGGDLLGYGTHGDLVVCRGVDADPV